MLVRRRPSIFYGVMNVGASEAPLLTAILHAVIIFTLLLGTLNNLLHRAEAALTETPQNTTAIVGDVVPLRCSTNLGPSRPVAWYWLQCRSSNEPSPVYLDGSVKSQFVDRMFVNKTEDGQYVLVVKDAQLSDGGTFTCIDDNNFGDAQRAKAELVVMGDRLRCGHNLSPCDVSPDNHGADINVTCRLEYSGSVPPDVHWKQDDGDDLGYKTISVPDSSVSSLLFRLSDELFNSSQFSCEVAHKFRRTKFSVATGKLPLFYDKNFQHSCLPAVAQRCSISEDVICLPGSLRWITDRHDLGIQLTFLNILRATRDFSERYKCESNCSIGDNSCKGNAVKKFDFNCTKHEVHTGDSLIANKTLKVSLGFAVAGVIAFIVAITLVIICRCQKKKWNNVKEEFWWQEAIHLIPGRREWLPSIDGRNINSRHFANMNEDDEKEFDLAFTNGGLDECLSLYNNNNRQTWKNNPIRIALLGNSGVGKSTFVNTVCGRVAMDRGAANVGTNETTGADKRNSDNCKPDFYMDRTGKIEWCDLPGTGTVTFKAGEYFNKINLDDFDCFIVIIATRFTEIDKKLGLEILNRTRKFYFVRSKIDIEIRNQMHDYRQSEEEIRENIRKETENNLEEAKFDQPLFLTNNQDITQFDFKALLQQIDQDIPEIKCRAMILSRKVNSEYAIKQKREELKRGIDEFVPTLRLQRCPFTRMCKNKRSMYTVCNINFHQLGLDKPSLVRRADSLHTNVDEIEEIVLTVAPKMLDTNWQHFKIPGTDMTIGESWWALVGYMLPCMGQDEFNRYMLAVLKQVVDRLADTSIEVTRCLKRTELIRSASASENGNVEWKSPNGDAKKNESFRNEWETK